MKRALLFSGFLVGAFLFAAMPARAAMVTSHDLSRGDGHHQMQRDDDKNARGNQRDHGDQRPIFSFSDEHERGFRDDRHDRDERRVERFDRWDFFPRFANLHKNRHFDRHHFRWPFWAHCHQPHKPPAQTPLPAALPLFGAGLAGLAVLRRRRARKDV